jgi:hypothetical protein
MRSAVRSALVASGLLQVLVAILQRLGWDPIWGVDAPYKAGGYMVGTLGNPTMLGEFLAVTGSVAPWSTLPAFAIGIYLSGNRLACLALLTAVLIRLWPRRTHGLMAWAPGLTWWHFIGIAAMNATLLATLSMSTKGLSTGWSRLHTWRIGLEVWWQNAPLTGSGPGGWQWFMPGYQDRFKAAGVSEVFTNPHSLPIGLLFEYGLIGVVLAGLVVWGNRRALVRSPVAWALLVLSLGSFPLYMAQVAAPALVALAVTWPHKTLVNNS